VSFELASAIAETPPGGVVNVPAGTYATSLLIDKPVSLIAHGVVVLDGQRRGSVLRVRTTGIVKLAGFSIVGGRTNTLGGGVLLDGGELELLQCTLRFNEAPVYGGGALALRAGTARVSQCRFEGNTGRQGGGVLVDEEAKLVMRDCLIAQNAGFDGGGLRVKEAASAELLGCTIADNAVLGETPTGGAVSLSGSTSRAPSVTLSHCVVSERKQGPEVLHNFAGAPGTLTLTRCLLPEWSRAVGGDNQFGPAGFVGQGTEPYALTAKSTAAGAGVAGAYGTGARDVLGRAREGVDLGAFAVPRN
jgi:hypothetical protein